MTPKQYVEIGKAVLQAVEDKLLTPEGQFKGQPDFPDDAAVASAVEASLVAQGVSIDPKVQRIIQGVVVGLSLVQ